MEPPQGGSTFLAREQMTGPERHKSVEVKNMRSNPCLMFVPCINVVVPASTPRASERERPEASRTGDFASVDRTLRRDREG
jgi:hypothetical protein